MIRIIGCNDFSHDKQAPEHFIRREKDREYVFNANWQSLALNPKGFFTENRAFIHPQCQSWKLVCVIYILPKKISIGLHLSYLFV